eukprot:scaffold2899_cov106-Isochrysis_galbana.AAC.5
MPADPSFAHGATPASPAHPLLRNFVDRSVSLPRRSMRAWLARMWSALSSWQRIPDGNGYVIEWGGLFRDQNGAHAPLLWPTGPILFRSFPPSHRLPPTRWCCTLSHASTRSRATSTRTPAQSILSKWQTACTCVWPCSRSSWAPTWTSSDGEAGGTTADRVGRV